MSTLNILLVEDSPTDRKLLLYILESNFQGATFREADCLKTAVAYLDKERFDCIILDLSLPDSVGKETFVKLTRRYPQIPIIVMTHNRDRELAIGMIQAGAADYILKDYTDDEDIYRRILFAVEKHRTTIRVLPESAASIQRLDKAKAQMLQAHESGQHSAVKEFSVETTSAVADISRRTFTTLQELHTKVERLTTQQEHTNDVIGEIKTALFGGNARPSLRAQIEVTSHRIDTLEERQDKAEDKAEQRQSQASVHELELKKARMSGRTKILIAILGFVVSLAGTYVTYRIATSGKNPSVEKP